MVWVSLRAVVAPSAPGKRPKTLSKEWFSSNTKTTCLILARACATLAGVAGVTSWCVRGEAWGATGATSRCRDGTSKAKPPSSTAHTARRQTISLRLCLIYPPKSRLLSRTSRLAPLRPLQHGQGPHPAAPLAVLKCSALVLAEQLRDGESDDPPCQAPCQDERVIDDDRASGVERHLGQLFVDHRRPITRPQPQ